MTSLSNSIGSITRNSIGGSISDPTYASVTGGFDPIVLFNQQNAGFYANPQALAQYFTTAAGSTPADDPGDPIGRWERQAGSFNWTAADAVRPSLAVFPSSGIRNLFTTATATLTTRNFTTRAVQYTLSFKGTGTVTLSGTSTAGPLVGTGANDRVSLTFTPTAGTLTLTVAGSCTEGQIVFGASPLDYQDVIAANNVTQSGIPSLYLPYFDGTEWMTAGTGTFGTASLFAAAGQAWTVWGVFRTLATGIVLAKTDDASGLTSTFLLNITAGGVARNRLRGGLNDIAASGMLDGNFHVWAIRWDGTNARSWVDSNASAAMTPGAAAQESTNILLTARTESGPAVNFVGHNYAAMTDYAPSDAQMTQLMAFLNSTYRQGL